MLKNIVLEFVLLEVSRSRIGIHLAHHPRLLSLKEYIIKLGINITNELLVTAGVYWPQLSFKNVVTHLKE